MSRTWRWNPRIDNDLVQRCLFILIFTGILNVYTEAVIPAFLYTSFWYFCYLATTVALVAAVAKSSLQFVPEGKAVLITGCDTGFGFQLAQHLTKIGFRVYAGCLRKNQGPGAKDLESFASTTDGRLKVVQLDVTVESQWVEVVKVIAEECPNGLWGIVNNAGWSTFGEIEWVPMDSYRRIMEINVFGVLRGLQHCLPLVRKSRGRVVTITSGLARMAVPTRSPYIVSKYAVLGLIECLRYEMEAFGVKVSMIEPGNFLAGTSLFNDRIIEQSANEMWNYMSDEVKSAYGKDYFDERKQIMKSYMTSGMSDLNPVIKAYTDGLLDIFPQKRYQPMNLYFKIRVFIATHLPEIFYDQLYVPYVKRT